MDQELRTAMRCIKSTGQTIDLIESLLEDASWDTIIKTQEVADRLRKAYHAKRIVRAFALPSFKLHEFKLCMQQYKLPELEIKITSINREEDAVIFKAEWNVDGSFTSKTMALYDDEGFCFGLRPYSGGKVFMQTGDVLKLTYRLGMD